jgi:1-acyl-sn-glycerol-3-phosphate acyltransferase
LLSPIWIPATVGVMRFGLRWRIHGAAAVRREYRALRRANDRPLLVCANHLTMVDSAIIAWALGSPAWFLVHYAALPWNVPERRNFAGSLTSRVLVYLMKCVPVSRGGDRGDVAGVLVRLAWLLGRGEVVLVFPEGGRSRSGRVEVENAAWGVGRLIGGVPSRRVLCVYLRGTRQEGFGDAPRRGEHFHVSLAVLRPRSELTGMRRARDLSQQVVHTLARLEEQQLDDRR